VWHEAPQCAETGNSPVYKQYEFLAAVHLFNAFQYLYLWRPWFRAHAAARTRLFLACVLLPELLNVLEASLYLRTATRYMAVQSNPACVASAHNPSWFKCADLLALRNRCDGTHSTCHIIEALHARADEPPAAPITASGGKRHV
jgi:hypothetical protein